MQFEISTHQRIKSIDQLEIDQDKKNYTDSIKFWEQRGSILTQFKQTNKE